MGNAKKKRFEKILYDIKKIKIQGARNIAKAALYAYSIYPEKGAKQKLISARPTEPMLFNVMEKTEYQSYKKILWHFDEAQEKINGFVFGMIKNGDIIFTHCHSTNVINALIYAKKRGKKFEVYNTETRPLFQGRMTAKELKKAGIKVTMFIDSALDVALSEKTGGKKANKIFLGSDALLNAGIVNKIGSGLIAKIAMLEKIPVFIIADSWKYTKNHVPIEQRGLNEVWERAPKNIKIKNPTFEFVPKKYIRRIVSELGVLTYEKFLKIVVKNNHF